MFWLLSLREYQIKGTVIVSAVDSKPFLETKHVIWDATYGDPRLPQQGRIISAAKYTGKFLGSYSFPFSLNIPRETNVNRAQLKELYLTKQTALPPHLSERGCFSLITYELCVTVKRSGLFRVDDMYVELRLDL